MKVLAVSLIIFFIVLAVSILVGFSDFGGVRRSHTAPYTNQLSTREEVPRNMPSGLRIRVEPPD
jgi:hypothetical protein